MRNSELLAFMLLYYYGFTLNVRIILRSFSWSLQWLLCLGKTLLLMLALGLGRHCMILPCLINPNSMAVVISPLKHLQAVHVLMFAQYHIKTIAINKDTPNDPELWKVCVLRLFFLVLGNTLLLRICTMEYILS